MPQHGDFSPPYKAKTSGQPFPNPSSPMHNPPALLIIRPANRIPADATLCRRTGWQPVPFPLIHIQPEANALAGLPAQLQQAAAAVWISPTAVETALPLLSDSPSAPSTGLPENEPSSLLPNIKPNPPIFSGSLIASLPQPQIAVGSGTAKALRQAGFARRRPRQRSRARPAPVAHAEPRRKYLDRARRTWPQPVARKPVPTRFSGSLCRYLPTPAARARLGAVCRRTARRRVDYFRRTSAPAVCRRARKPNPAAAILAILRPSSAHCRGTEPSRRGTHPPAPFGCRAGKRFNCRTATPHSGYLKMEIPMCANAASAFS